MYVYYVHTVNNINQYLCFPRGVFVYIYLIYIIIFIYGRAAVQYSVEFFDFTVVYCSYLL